MITYLMYVLTAAIGFVMFEAIWRGAPPSVVTGFVVAFLLLAGAMVWAETHRVMKQKRFTITTSRRREWD